MKVSDLQDILSHVGHLLESAGGRGATELMAFRECLDPFREMTAKQLTSELRKLTEAKEAKPKAPRRTAKAPLDVDGMVREAQDVYGRATDPSVTVEQIEEMAKRLEALTKDALVRVAEGIELVGMKSKKTKGEIVAAIRQRILSRKGATQRVNLIDRSPFATADTQ